MPFTFTLVSSGMSTIGRQIILDPMAYAVNYVLTFDDLDPAFVAYRGVVQTNLRDFPYPGVQAVYQTYKIWNNSIFIGGLGSDANLPFTISMTLRCDPVEWGLWSVT